MLVNAKTQERIDKIMRVVRLLPWVLLAVVYFFGRLNKVISAVAILFSLASLVFGVKYPQYFNDEDTLFFQWHSYSANVGDIISCCVVPPLALGLRALNDFKFPSFFRLDMLALLASLLLGALLRFLFRKQNIRVWVVIGVFFFLCISMFGVCAQLNYILDDTSSDTQPCRVVDLEIDRGTVGGRTRSKTFYYCTVETESGEQTKLPISRKQYYTLQRGNWVCCYFGKGAFGVEYSYISNAPPVPLKKIPASIP